MRQVVQVLRQFLAIFRHFLAILGHFGSLMAKYYQGSIVLSLPILNINLFGQ